MVSRAGVHHRELNGRLLCCLDPIFLPCFASVLRIRDVYPGSRIRIFSIPDSGSRIRTVSIPDPGSASKNLSILTPKKPKKWFLSSRKYDPGCSSRIPDPDADFLPIPGPGSRGQKRTGSRIRIRNTVSHLHYE
jgi:hypothetical protein